MQRLLLLLLLLILVLTFESRIKFSRSTQVTASGMPYCVMPAAKSFVPESHEAYMGTYWGQVGPFLALFPMECRCETSCPSASPLPCYEAGDQEAETSRE